ncbi:MAG: fused DSP-PTPase phosphatase/NAD kinase-like protein [Blastocatellia bacterium]
MNKLLPTILTLALAFLLACSLTGPALGKTSRRRAAANLPNFGKTNDHYYRGAQPRASQYDDLARLGVKTIIDLRDDAQAYARPAAERAGLRYVNLPLNDKRRPLDDAAGRFLALVKDQANWPVYVHCAGGRHRTGAMTAVYRMTVDGWDLDRAYAEMKQYDFYTRNGHKPYKTFVEEYYRNLQAEASAPTTGHQTGQTGPEAVWGPGMSILQQIKEECAVQAGPSFGECFARGMQKAGASPQALAFTNRIHNDGFMRDFRNAGTVDIAYVYYPFRANEPQGAFLVNGSPNLIDVDDQSLLPQDGLKENPTYARLARKYPGLTLWPGNRNGTDAITASKLPGGGSQFAVAYLLRDGCHACKKIGTAQFAFHFDKAGTFSGVKLLNVAVSSK